MQATLETNFLAQQRRRACASDELVLGYYALPLIIAAAVLWSGQTSLSDKLCLPGLAVVGSGLVLAKRRRPATYLKYRTALICGYKLLCGVCCVRVKNPQGDDSWLQFWQSEVLIHGKVSLLLSTGLHMRLRLWLHLALQSCVAAIVLLHNPSLCLEFQRRTPASKAKYEKELTQYSDSQINAVLNAAFYRQELGSRPASPRQEMGAAPLVGSCLRFQAFHQVALGLLLTSLACFALERKARFAFYRAALDPPEQQPLQAKLRLRDVLAWSTSIYLGLGFLWHALGWTVAQHLESY